MTAPWTWHGGALAAARAHFGDDGEPWIDLSTGINPHGWDGDVAIDWRRLPETDALAALEAAAAAHFGVDPAHVCAVPGSETGLRIAAALIGGGACHIAPAYRTHGEIFADSRAIAHDAIATCAGSLVLANPNNPDGRSTDPETLLRWMDRRADDDAWLLVDEAFADADAAPGMAPHIDDARAMLVFRSFGKFFGLAGLRLGFVVGPRPFLAQLRARLGAWPVSAAAIAIGTAAYRDSGWIAATRTRLAIDAAALDALLARRGLAATGDCPLFRLIEAPDAAALFERLARAAILTRPFAERPDWLRIGLPADADARARLDRALAGG